jgi:tRNA (adenine37-N6)-methyltransferase
MRQFAVNPVGAIRHSGDGMYIQISEEFIPALKELEGFSHLNVLWWFHEHDTPEARGILEVEAPYRTSPPSLGIFATRSPVRPNPIALSTVQVISIDYDKGTIGIAYIDAHDHTPVLDLKPYTPSLDRVEHPAVPDWCSHWPKSLEASASFNWGGEFNF